jgi:hypothetical protein
MPTGTQGDKTNDPTADRSNSPVSRQSGQPMATPESRQQFRETRSATIVLGLEYSSTRFCSCSTILHVLSNRRLSCRGESSCLSSG